MAEVQADLLEFAEILLLSSDLIADSAQEFKQDLAILQPEEEQELYDSDDGDRFVAEILELEGLFWLENASSLILFLSPKEAPASCLASFLMRYGA